MTISLAPEIAAALEAVARKQGTTPEKLLIPILRDQLRAMEPSRQALPEPRDEWEAMVLGAGRDCGVSLSDEALSSDGLYD